MDDYIVKPVDALLIFTDIVDSSVYSSILGLKEYARQVLQFQRLFEQLANLYFPDQPYFKEPVDSWRRISSRGDEGLVFIVDRSEKTTDLVHKGVKFAFELKARLKWLNESKSKQEKAPKEMSIGVGIHYGQVVPIVKPRKKDGQTRSCIDKIIGYSINYAKRVEASSRAGKFSRVFLSKEAANLLAGFPIVLYKHIASLKGIQENEEVFEVRSAFFPGIPVPPGEKNDVLDNEKFLEYYTEKDNEKEFIREAWLKSFVLSVLDARKDQAKSNSLKKKYHDKIEKLAWVNPIEDDPILLFSRARECQYDKKFSRAAAIFKTIVGKFPDFLHARIKLVEACYDIIKSKDKVSAEIIFVRDTAEEFLEKYDSILSPDEQKKFEEILEKVQTLK
jgi:class 3 adenylate cyclase